MIDRALVSKKYPPFSVFVSEGFRRELRDLFRSASPTQVSTGSALSNWPAILTLHGTACLMTVWEDMGVDPLAARLIAEKFAHFRDPSADEQLTGQVQVEDISETVESNTGIEEQVDLLVDFRDSSKRLIATYQSSYRIPLATSC